MTRSEVLWAVAVLVFSFCLVAVIVAAGMMGEVVAG